MSLLGLEWDGWLLPLSQPAETARLALDGTVLASSGRYAATASATLDMLNHRVEHPGTVATLG